MSSLWEQSRWWLVLAMVFSVGCQEQKVSDPTPRRDVVQALRTEPEVEEELPESSAPIGWGTLRGRFLLEGAAPPRKPIHTGGKDAQVCDCQPILDPTLIVGPEGGIQDVLVYARSVTRVHPSFAELAAQPAELHIKGCMYERQISVFYVGQEVSLFIDDPIAHNPAISPPGETLYPLLFGTNATQTCRFKRAQHVPVLTTCSIHPWMHAYVFPRKDPYAGISDEQGHFQIANLPAGEWIEFRFWHQANQKELTAGPAKKGIFRLRLEPDEDHDLCEIAIPLAQFIHLR